MPEKNSTNSTQKESYEKRKSPSAEKSRLSKLAFVILFGIVFLIASALFAVSVWYKNTFNISFSDLLFTLRSPVEGTGSSTIRQILTACVPPIIVLMVLYVTAVIYLWEDVPAKSAMRKFSAAACILVLLAAAKYAFFAFRIPEYMASDRGKTDLYEREYVDPNTVDITDEDGNSQNLICIYLESMETTYASKQDGGAQETINYMPHLTEYAKENISFSDGEGLGGFRSIAGTSWTMGSLVGTTSGVPFSLAVFGESSHNELGRDGTFLNGLTTLGDILEEKGYAQEFLCGSNISFAGRDTYFRIHGDYKLFDYYSAIENGYIDKGYMVWWGYEDERLYRIAKDEVTALAAGDQPFNFTMLTVDTHHVGGYVCNACENNYDLPLANVVSCADRLVSEFIEWCKKQPFYENTTIVVIGDHPRMDTQLVNDVDFYDRTMFNCYFNAVPTPSTSTGNRLYTSLDMFPTILSAMGFEIEGDRLGLGVNMFSDTPTIPERYGQGRKGYDRFEAEVSMDSVYYKNRFVLN